MSDTILVLEKETREVMVFASLESAISYIEPYDIDVYEVFSTEGDVYQLKLDHPIKHGPLGMLSMAKVLVSPTGVRNVEGLRKAILYDLQRSDESVSDSNAPLETLVDELLRRKQSSQ